MRTRIAGGLFPATLRVPGRVTTLNEKAAYAAFFGLGTSMCFRAAAGLNAFDPMRQRREHDQIRRVTLRTRMRCAKSACNICLTYRVTPSVTPGGPRSAPTATCPVSVLERATFEYALREDRAQQIQAYRQKSV